MQHSSPDINSKQFMVNIAYLYYKEHMTQAQIAKKLHISRSLVSKLLVQSRENGIVEVVIHEELVRIHQELEDRLKRILGLQEVICTEPTAGQTERESVAIQAANYLEKRIQNVKNVAVSGGGMMKEVAVNFVPSIPMEHVTFVPICGGVDDELWELQSNTVCEYFVSHSGAFGKQFHAPVVVDSENAKQILMHQNYIRKVITLAQNAEIAMVGIGTGKRYFDIAENYLPKEQCEFDDLRARIKGDIAFNYYDSDGQLIDCPWNRQNMTLSLDHIRKIPEVICVACEREKAESIYIAIHSNIINTLIVPASLGSQILKLHSKYL